MALRFHWRLPQGGEQAGASRGMLASLAATGLPDLEAQVRFCQVAEDVGIDSLLIDFGWSKPDPILLAAALGAATKKIKFIIAYRSGLTSPAFFVQQINTLSALIDGRFSLNIVAGHSPEEQRYYGDFLKHNERYARTDEFLGICHAFWRRDGPVNFSGNYYQTENGRLNTPFISAEDSPFPELYIAGNSTDAQRLAVRQGSCWMRLADRPERIRDDVTAVLGQGREVGLRMSVIARPTRAEALRAAYRLVESADIKFKDRDVEKSFIKKSDSICMNTTYELADVEWLTQVLWTGAIRSHGAAAIAMVGSAEEIGSAILDYAKLGVSQFIFSGWPKLEEMIFFGKEILPLVRAEQIGVS